MLLTWNPRDHQSSEVYCCKPDWHILVQHCFFVFGENVSSRQRVSGNDFGPNGGQKSLVAPGCWLDGNEAKPCQPCQHLFAKRCIGPWLKNRVPKRSELVMLLEPTFFWDRRYWDSRLDTPNRKIFCTVLSAIQSHLESAKKIGMERLLAIWWAIHAYHIEPRNHRAVEIAGLMSGR